MTRVGDMEEPLLAGSGRVVLSALGERDVDAEIGRGLAHIGGLEDPRT
jgi:hypothetical protein